MEWILQGVGKIARKKQITAKGINIFKLKQRL
jgi:hypothetical protein